MTAWISLAVATLALVASAFSVYRTQLAPAHIQTLCGVLRLRLYPYSNETERWFMPVFAVSVSFTNEGARAGVVDGLRLRVNHLGVDPADNFEIFSPVVHLDRPLGLRPDTRENREEWLDASEEWASFTVLTRQTITQHLAFQSTAWIAPVKWPLRVSLEVHTSNQDWETVGDWEVELNEDQWGLLARGGSCPGHDLSAVDQGPGVSPGGLPHIENRST